MRRFFLLLAGLAILLASSVGTASASTDITPPPSPDNQVQATVNVYTTGVVLWEHNRYGGTHYNLQRLNFGPCDAQGYTMSIPYEWRNKVSSISFGSDKDTCNFIVVRANSTWGNVCWSSYLSAEHIGNCNDYAKTVYVMRR